MLTVGRQSSYREYSERDANFGLLSEILQTKAVICQPNVDRAMLKCGFMQFYQSFRIEGRFLSMLTSSKLLSPFIVRGPINQVLSFVSYLVMRWMWSECAPIQFYVHLMRTMIETKIITKCSRLISLSK